MPAKLFGKFKPAILIILIIILGFTIYLNSLRGEFIWDDAAFVKNNVYIKDWSNIIPVFTRDSGAGSSVVLNFYRPLQLFTYIIDYSLWGLNVFGYHLTNVVLHILVALTVYRLIMLIFGSIPLSFFTAVLFVVHPIHTEAVSYISGRGDLLSALFILLCLIFYIKNTQALKLGSTIIMVSSYILALFSKENALVVIPLLLLYHYVFRQKIKWRFFLPFLVVSFIYLLVRFVKLKSFFFGLVVTAKRIPGFFSALANYFKILLLPINLHMDYGNKFFSIIEPQVLFGLVASCLLLFLAFRKRDSNRLVVFAVFWFFIALLPTTSIYPIGAFYMAEHWLYLPSIGFFLILGRGLVFLYEKKNYSFIALGLLICLLFSYTYLTVKQNNYWKSGLEIYKRTLEYTPNSYMAHTNLGDRYLNSGNKTEAIKEYLKAVNSNPRFLLSYFKLGELYFENGDQEAGEKMFLKAIETNPSRAETYYYLGNVYYSFDKIERSIGFLKKAIDLDPAYLAAYNDLASNYAQKGNLVEAIKLWNKCIKLEPDFMVAHFNLSVFYFKRKEYDLAIKHCDQLIALGGQIDARFLDELKPFRNKK